MVEESVEERAERYKKAETLREEKERFAHSTEGMKAAKEAYEQCMSGLESLVERIKADVGCAFDRRGQYAVVRGGRCVLVCSWDQESSLKDSKLVATIYDHLPKFLAAMGGYRSHSEEAQQLGDKTFKFDLAEIDRAAWVGKDGTELTSDEVADQLVRWFMDNLEKPRK